MDAARMQSLIYSGYGREAQRTGFDYDVYRFASPLTPLDTSNKVATLKCSFVADAKAEVAHTYQTPTWTLRADGNQLEVFDLLVSQDGNTIWYVASMQSQLPIEAIQCNNKVTISHLDYSTGFPVAAPYAIDLPMFKQFRREDISRNSLGEEIGNAISHWRAFIPLPNHTLKQGDIVSDEDGNSYTIDAPDFTSAGYAAQIRLTTT